MRRFCPNPVFVLIDVRPDVEGIPTTAYVSVEEVETVSMNDGTLVIHILLAPTLWKKYSVQIYICSLVEGRERNPAIIQAHPIISGCIRSRRGDI
jgi:hypothetical protein